MKERPILFNTEMVRAVLDGRKTQTRRVVKPQPEFIEEEKCGFVAYHTSTLDPAYSCRIACPYGKPGDRLWVRETFCDLRPYQDRYGYKATDTGLITKWKPSIHMPRKASRINLIITDIMVERVQEITRLECYREGWPADDRQMLGVDMADAGLDDANVDDASIEWFADLWDSINAKRGYDWDSNPWVWVVEFEVLT